MTLDLVEVVRPAGADRYSWVPFEPGAGFNPDWWERPRARAQSLRYFAAVLDDVVIARVELDDDFGGSDHTGAPDLGRGALEVQLIEVAAHRRGGGIGAEVVSELVRGNPGRRLLALSEHADGFWASLGWDRYDLPTDPRHYRPLFIAPAAR